jgi:hypothetical protein
MHFKIKNIFKNIGQIFDSYLKLALKKKNIKWSKLKNPNSYYYIIIKNIKCCQNIFTCIVYSLDGSKFWFWFFNSYL